MPDFIHLGQSFSTKNSTFLPDFNSLCNDEFAVITILVLYVIVFVVFAASFTYWSHMTGSLELLTIVKIV